MVANASTPEISTHHLTLSDGVTTLGLMLCDGRGNLNVASIDEVSNPRTAMRVAQGPAGYSDFEAPYTPIMQADWSGGMGQKDFERDATRYLDGNHVDTSRGVIMPSGKAQETTGYRTVITTGDNNGFVDGSLVSSGSVYNTYSFTASTTMTARELRFRIKPPTTFPDNPGGFPVDLSVKVVNDSAGVPNLSSLLSPEVVYGSYTPGVPLMRPSEPYIIRLNGPFALVSGTRYWICIKISYPSPSGNYAVEKDTSTTEKSGQNTSVVAGSTIYAQFSGAGVGTGLFFDFNGLTHCITRSDDGTTPTLWRNGYIAAVRATTTDNTQVNTSLNLSGVNLTGKIIKVIAGPGVNEQTPWRAITSNTTTGTNDTITVSPAWNMAHSTSTQFVILGLDTWTACTIGTFAPTKPITDVCVVDDKVYLCQGVNADVGTAANVVRLTMSIAAAGPTYTGADEGYQRDFMEVFVDTDGKKKVFSTINNTSAVYRAEIAAPLVFTQMNNSLACGNTNSRITGLTIYGDPQMPYVFKQDGFGSVSNTVYAPIPITEMPAVKTETMGRAAVQSNRYLYFSMGEGVERYYNGVLDDVGPDRDEGLPAGRKGEIVHMVAYPGGVIYAAVDAGDGGYSSILKYNGEGWCEVYRSSVLGKRIRRLHIENVSGLKYQRLWFSEEEDLIWIPIAKNPLQATGYQFNTSATLETSYFYTSYADIVKFWNSLKLFVVNATAARYVKVYYRKDNDTAWTQVTGNFDTSPREEIDFTAADSLTGVKLQLKFELVSDSATTPVYIERAVIEAVTRIPAKKAWNITALISDHQTDLLGNMTSLPISNGSTGIKDKLDAWADSRTQAAPLTMETLIQPITSKKVFIDPGSFRPLSVKADPVNPKRVALLARMTLIEA